MVGKDICSIKYSERLYRLFCRSYKEAGLEVPVTENVVAKYPCSFINQINVEPKDITFNFIGSINQNEECRKNREWVIRFAMQHFDKDSYYQITDHDQNYVQLGDYDKTFENNSHFVPEQYTGNRVLHFDPHFYDILSRSQFTLCPAGDAPWSMRFYEAIMCRSIPILEKKEHRGRNELERKLGYKFYVLGDQYVYRHDWVEHNYAVFIEHQSFINKTT